MVVNEDDHGYYKRTLQPMTTSTPKKTKRKKTIKAIVERWSAKRQKESESCTSGISKNNLMRCWYGLHKYYHIHRQELDTKLGHSNVRCFWIVCVTISTVNSIQATSTLTMLGPFLCSTEKEMLAAIVKTKQHKLRKKIMHNGTSMYSIHGNHRLLITLQNYCFDSCIFLVNGFNTGDKNANT